MIILTGATGKLGSALYKNLRSFNRKILTPSRQEMNLQDGDSISDYLYNVDNSLNDKSKVSVIHCAAMIGAKACEDDKDKAYNTNVLGTRKIARICSFLGWHMYYISTDYVFDGRKGNYSENDTPNPLTYYSLTKLLGEESVLSLNKKVIRLSHFPDVCNYKSAYADKITSALLTTEMAYLLSGVIYKLEKANFVKLDINRRLIHIGGKPKSFYDLAKKSSLNVEKAKAPEGTPMDTSFNLSKMRMILGEK